MVESKEYFSVVPLLYLTDMGLSKLGRVELPFALETELFRI